MKILLTTIVDNINFGTYLQAFATVHVLRKRNMDVEVLNYIRPYLTGAYYAKKIARDKSKPFLFRIFKSIAYYMLNNFMIWNLKRYLKQRVSLTDIIREPKDLMKYQGKYDLYLTGSDQVWNTQHNFGVDEVFFFKGIKGRKRSMAASIGVDSFDSEDADKIASLLKDYSYISVRESFGVDVLKSIGITNSHQILDPTLLLDKKQWLKLVDAKSYDKEKYLLVYSVELEKNNTVYDVANKIAKEKNLKIYVVSPTIKLKKDIPMADRIFSLAKVDTFISLMANADYVVCSSFHGTAFSINFNRQFVTIVPHRFNSRVESLLNLLNLRGRFINDIKSLPQTEIDYRIVNEALNKERAASLKNVDEIVTVK